MIPIPQPQDVRDEHARPLKWVRDISPDDIGGTVVRLAHLATALHLAGTLRDDQRDQDEAHQ